MPPAHKPHSKDVGLASSCPAPLWPLLSRLHGAFPTIISFIRGEVEKEDGQEKGEKPPSEAFEDAKQDQGQYSHRSAFRLQS